MYCISGKMLFKIYITWRFYLGILMVYSCTKTKKTIERHILDVQMEEGGYDSNRKYKDYVYR